MNVRGVLIVFGILLVVFVMCTPEEERIRLLETQVRMQADQMQLLIQTQQKIAESIKSIEKMQSQIWWDKQTSGFFKLLMK